MSITTDPAVQAYFAGETDAREDMFEELFTLDAKVTDEGKTYSGINEIKAWNQAARQKYQYSVEPLSSQNSDKGVVVPARLTGTFPGSPVVVTFTFGLQHGKIQTLEIG